MKKNVPALALSMLLALGGFRASAQTDAELKRMSASQAGASPLFFDPATEKIPAIDPGNFSDARETVVRGGLPNFFAKIKAGKPVTVGLIGGSITQGMYCYRTQATQYIQKRLPDVKFNWLNAGVSGTGTDLASCRIGEQILKHNPDLVFIEFAVNGGFQPGMEGMIRQIIRNNPSTDICLIYTVLNPQAKKYMEQTIPEPIQSLEKMAAYYDLPGIHMGIEAATLEANNKLIWKGDTAAIKDKIVFSADGIHPLREGGNLYANAIARGFDKLMEKTVAAQKQHVLPTAIIASNWEDAKMLDPLESAQFSKGWTRIDTKENAKLRQFNSWFPYVMKCEKPGAGFTFRFKGSMFGFFDIGGPEMGQVTVTIDGKVVKMKEASGKGFRLLNIDSTGNELVNRFNNFCNNRYRGQYEFIETTDGEHMVTITLSGEKADKAKILGEKQLQDITEHPEKYDRTVMYLGKILLRGELIKKEK
ncbi:SGNH/GDSL hydrolase family protein [Pseudoflavitalea sp. G-6-1-2]|uniref:SGNH/GDSL hydrolase family protein n=1 Tax=Pseudoflavitalea sp. G-6-1-2 TaxID=2728841 RepID=UPI00146F01CB|nr:SGNH/GDSL hydrolase family protein [Pseudoflavitalea sp. G-6-1-2]NML21238.1 SGNH/GDSL hydrolase family protein [Pseudoflavitalea sp. G-6-1-2]